VSIIYWQHVQSAVLVYFGYSCGGTVSIEILLTAAQLYEIGRVMGKSIQIDIKICCKPIIKYPTTDSDFIRVVAGRLKVTTFVLVELPPLLVRDYLFFRESPRLFIS